MPDALSLDYLAVRPCGCAAGWASGDNPKRDLANFVADMIRHGMDIRRVTTEEARAANYTCTHGDRDRSTQLSLMEAAP